MVTTVNQHDRAILIIGAIALAFLLSLPGNGDPSPYLSSLEEASTTLKGKAAPSDLTQDIIGFRALVRQENPYPILGPAMRELGLHWDVSHPSTHPPTAFLLVAPIAFLPWSWASAAWAWLMVVLLASAFVCYGITWKAALGLSAIALLWPPIAVSLGQMTIIWLVALAAGYRFYVSGQQESGIAVGLGSLAKLLPGLLALALVLKRQWSALLSIVLLWLTALAILLLLQAGSVFQYLEANRTTSPEMIQRADNSSLLANSYRSFGWLGVTLVLGFFLAIVWANRNCFHDGRPFALKRLWMILTYFSVVLMPVLWIYSLTPLLPIIIWLIYRRKLSTRTIGWCSLAIPFFVEAWGPGSVPPLTIVTLLVGIGLFVDALPFRILTAFSLRDLTDSASN